MGTIRLRPLPEANGQPSDMLRQQSEFQRAAKAERSIKAKPTEPERAEGLPQESFHGRSQNLVERNVVRLRPHPGFTKHCLGPSIDKMSYLSERGEIAFQDPLTITQDNYILDGYARWHLACTQKRVSVLCLELQLTEEDALLWLVQRHRRSNGLNDFVRVLLALELESFFKARAKSNQRMGGQTKGSSNLTQADRIDVRSEIAAAAGVSIGNVTKIKQLLVHGHPELIDALRKGEVSIHRAWGWSKSSTSEQVHFLQQLRNGRGINATIRALIAAQRSQKDPAATALNNLLKALLDLQCEPRMSKLIEPIDNLIAQINCTLMTQGDPPDGA